MTPLEIVAPIEAGDLEVDVRWLSGEDALADGPVASRDLHHVDLARARDALLERLSSMPGLVVREEPFDVASVPGALPGVANLVAELPGADSEAPLLVIGAHYDSIASFDDGWTDPATMPAPGADDDASGVAAVLAIAGALSGYEPGFERPVRFVLFSAEEYGLLGSFAHVDGLAEPVDAMIQLDPVGYDPGDRAWLWVTHDEPSAALGDAFEASAIASGAALTVNPVEAADIGGDARSDHYPFWDAGIPALHLASFPQPPTYHTMGDTVANVDFAYTREVAVAVGAFAAERSGPLEAKPRGCATSGTPTNATFILFASVLVAARRRAIGTRAQQTVALPAPLPTARTSLGSACQERTSQP